MNWSHIHLWRTSRCHDGMNVVNSVSIIHYFALYVRFTDAWQELTTFATLLPRPFKHLFVLGLILSEFSAIIVDFICTLLVNCHCFVHAFSLRRTRDLTMVFFGRCSSVRDSSACQHSASVSTEGFLFVAWIVNYVCPSRLLSTIGQYVTDVSVFILNVCKW